MIKISAENELLEYVGYVNYVEYETEISHNYLTAFVPIINSCVKPPPISILM